MKIELTKKECQNVTVALISLSKAPDVNVNVMKVLINLSDKFVWVEPIKVEVNGPVGIGTEPVKEEVKK